MAYVSDESGQDEIYLTSFPDGKGKWRVSTNGGFYSAWRADSKELIYTGITDDFFACSVTAKGAELEVGASEHLFHTTLPAIGVLFDASLDGKRLLVNHSEEEAQVPLQVVTNWVAELKK